jgi:UDP-N-acetylmuramate dehydrogenase
MGFNPSANKNQKNKQHLTIQHNIPLQPLNTFGIHAEAKDLITITHPDQLPHIGTLPQPKHIIGGGSNILLTTNPGGLVLLNRLKGIEQIHETDQHIYLRVASGEVWHHLVMHTVQQGLGGIENLALIPGTVGASPMQNIGAYGVEVKDTIESVTFWHWAHAQYYTYTNADCHFGYRESIFKHQLKDQVFITSVVYKLSKHPALNTSYGAIEQELQAMHITTPSVANIAQAVINIRSSKLPDPAFIGNAGSFFKNPTIPIAQYNSLKAQHPAIPSYPVTPDTVKVPAGWLIEQCGWKGYRRGQCGVHAKQALVLVNYGTASGTDIWQLSTDILQSVQQKFGIELEREVNVW